ETSQAVGGFWSLFGVSARDIVIARPVDECNGVEAVAMVVHVPDIVAELHGRQYAVWVYLLVNALILTILWFFRMRRLVIAPLENLVDMSESFGIAEADYIGPVSQKNEFGQLADALGNMLGRIETDKQKLSETVASLEEANAQLRANQQVLVEAEKFAAVGRLSAGLAHEIGNPLGIIQGYIELLGRDDIDEAERVQYRDRADKELARVTGLIRQLLDLARKKSDQQSSTYVAPVIDEVVDMLRQQKNTGDIRFSVACAGVDGQVRCSEADLHQVLLNCLLNALDAIHEQGRVAGEIDLSCRSREEEERRFVDIVIQDNGKGIQADGLKNVFDPFFTTKEVGRGTGLGLSVCRSIVETCGGAIRLESEEAVYTRVVITLPVVEVQ
ncbi:MAG: sensor histidine kinase, partial [Desulfopila sp.]